MRTEPRSQLKFAFTRVIFTPEMGQLIGEKKVCLYEWFLLGPLQVKQYYLDYNNPNEPPTDFICPFCEEGRLKLKRVVPVQEGLPKRHIANEYYYECAHQCGGEFFGRANFSP